MGEYVPRLMSDADFMSEASIEFAWEMRKVELVLAECRKRGLAGRLELRFDVKHERDTVSGFLWVHHLDRRVLAYADGMTALLGRVQTPEEGFRMLLAGYPRSCPPPEPPWEQAADELRAAVLAADEAWLAELTAPGGRADD